ncbi:hypothetical protein [Avibacterium paragallinarum]|uniref:Uncharacterized protein n=1 Tax=Avibacterium paragallinarum TaxID=728 RepID=A0ABU7QK79_AVIPA|nr:hypothetical protein [Avibacterium paragallinarum]MEE3609377.1 hypothetical protein [Avibacterium paragallinarum]MEE3621506.1 hypothetical protein [Avibacterium paragallinarum]MEE3669354.1 hypothetical protein [Avibacterium paragallinarum]MEE3681658.1 hypothetical protein [Avibacterium paragallinarum]MEE4386660.1 hypothetical protein [Avibacterium paragallinarum]
MTSLEKENLKKAILKAVENGCTEPELLLSKLERTFELIDRIGNVITGQSSEK